MSKEKSMVLKMLSRGKILPEEAVRLLTALGEEPLLEETAVQAAVEEPTPAIREELDTDNDVDFDMEESVIGQRRRWNQRPRFPDPSYAAAIKRLGVNFTAEQLIDLEMAYVTPSDVEDLLSVRRQEWTTDDLARMLVHGVTKQMVLQFHELGMGDLSPRNLVEFAIHHVTPDLVRRAHEAGFMNSGPGALVKFAIHKVDFEAVKAARALGEVREGEAVKMSIHGVTTAFIHSLSAAFPEVRLDELLDMRIHNISPRYVDELRELDLEDLSPSRAVEMKIHGVESGEARQFKQALGGHVTASQLIEFAIHNISPDFLTEMQKLGIKGIDKDQLVAMRIHGVSVEAARRAKEVYGEKLSAHDLVEMAIFGRLP